MDAWMMKKPRMGLEFVVGHDWGDIQGLAASPMKTFGSPFDFVVTAQDKRELPRALGLGQFARAQGDEDLRLNS